MQTISAKEAQEKVAAGAILVDIRGRDEFAREYIEGAINLPADSFDTADKSAINAAKVVIFHCLGGVRTKNAEPQLEKLVQAGQEAYIMEGGMNAWKAAGMKTVFNSSQPLPLMRQVQIAAGSLIVVGSLLTLINCWFIIIPLFVGCGLTFAGITGFCGMAIILGKMPWNKNLPNTGTNCAVK